MVSLRPCFTKTTAGGLKERSVDKVLVTQHEDVFASPAHHVKSHVWWHMPVTPALWAGREDRQTLEVCWPTSLTEMWEPQVQGGTIVSARCRLSRCPALSSQQTKPCHCLSVHHLGCLWLRLSAPKIFSENIGLSLLLTFCSNNAGFHGKALLPQGGVRG